MRLPWVERLLDWWKALLQSNECYDVGSYNCCDVVLHSLQFALDESIPDITSIKTSRMREHKNYSASLPLKGHKYEISAKSGSKSTTVYQYCYLLAQEINNTLKNSIPPVVVRYNRWNKALGSLTKFDFNPN